jgi:hypothetical protein
MHRHAHLEVTGVIRAFIRRLTKRPKPTGEVGILPGKTRTRANVGKIKDQVLDWVTFVFERGRDSQTFTALEKAKDHAAAPRRPVRLDQPEPTPGIRGGGDDLDAEVMFQFGTSPANHRERGALRRIKQIRA